MESLLISLFDMCAFIHSTYTHAAPIEHTCSTYVKMLKSKVNICQQLIWALGSILEAYMVSCVPASKECTTPVPEAPEAKRRKVVSMSEVPFSEVNGAVAFISRILFFI